MLILSTNTQIFSLLCLVKLPTLSKLMINEIDIIQTSLSMIDFIKFLGAISFLAVPELRKRQLHAVYHKPFRAYCLLKYNLYFEKPIAFRYSFVQIWVNRRDCLKILYQNLYSGRRMKKSWDHEQNHSSTDSNLSNFCICANWNSE